MVMLWLLFTMCLVINDFISFAVRPFFNASRASPIYSLIAIATSLFAHPNRPCRIPDNRFCRSHFSNSFAGSLLRNPVFVFAAVSCLWISGPGSPSPLIFQCYALPVEWCREIFFCPLRFHAIRLGPLVPSSSVASLFVSLDAPLFFPWSRGIERGWSIACTVLLCEETATTENRRTRSWIDQWWILEASTKAVEEYVCEVKHELII